MTEVLENLSEDEAYLFALLSDPSGLDQAELVSCGTCGERKAETEFHFRSKARGTRHKQCASCRNARIRDLNQRPEERAKRRSLYLEQAEARKAYSRNWHATKGIKKAYGISREEADLMIAQQGGRCAICGTSPERLHVDHDHETGRVRGMLCGKCNRALGLMGDAPERLKQAARYLERTDT